MPNNCPCRTMREIAYPIRGELEVVISFTEHEIMLDDYQYRYKLQCIKYCPLCGRKLQEDEQMKIEGL